jgi:hypothetical protein
MKTALLVLCFPMMLTLGCRTTQPVEITERGWIIGCANSSPANSSSHGLPLLMISTHPGGHFDVLTLVAKTAPSCDTWQKWDVHNLDMAEPTQPDYEVVLIQHLTWQGESDGTWELKQIKTLGR